MVLLSKPVFEFNNQISPRYIQSLLLQLQYGHWYDMSELRNILRASGLDLKGEKIVLSNTTAWSQLGLGQSQVIKTGRASKKSFQLTNFGKQLIDIFSTNQELFYDVMHFLLYSTWLRSHNLSKVRFWLYTKVCDTLWTEAPSSMDSFELTSRLQAESRQIFAEYTPTFPERSVRAVFPWLGTLTPSFLSKCGGKSQLCSSHRSYCTPQLFHLATDLVYNASDLRYGTSMAMDDQKIEAICKVCLLDPERFWTMADLTCKSIRSFDIRKGQWNISIALEGPPDWIDLPDLTSQPPADQAGQVDRGGS